MKEGKKRENSFKFTEEENPAMETAVKLQIDDQSFIKGMAEYIQRLKDQPNEVAQKEAKEALIRTGVTTKSGKLKKSIVSWE